MKFFTPDLYRRCQSADDDVVDRASEEWEQANEQYEQYLQALQSRLSPHVRELSSLLLHDARVQAIARRGNRLIMVLHKDIPPRDLVLLDYDLDGEPMMEPFVDCPEAWNQHTDFQFDELDLEEGEPVRFMQSIVFGNGWLMRLRFRDVQITLASPVVPAA